MAQSSLAVAVALFALEGSAYRRGYRRSPRELGEELALATLTTADITDAPDSIDWSAKGGTSAINDQGDCGSCWAFSTMETVESAVFMSSGTLPPPLSVQQLVACDKGADGGCDGGDPITGVKYLVRVGGMDTASDYPDTSSKSGKNGRCKWDKRTVVSVQGSQFAVPECTKGTCKTNEDTLAAAVAKYGPLSISINSGDRQACDWEKYKGGVQRISCAAKANLIDHSVQLVGYDKTASPPYWKVRNSWGTKWGENGYIRLAMGVNSACIGCEALIIHATSKTPVAPTPPPAPTPAPVPTPEPPTPPQPSPTPAPPTPPSPPGPTPTQNGVRQIGCLNKQCSTGCKTILFAFDQCVKLAGGGSAKAVECGSNGVHSHYWDNNNNCRGLRDDQDWNDIDDCVRDKETDGRVGTPDMFVEFECVGSSANATAPMPIGFRRSNRTNIRRIL